MDSNQDPRTEFISSGPNLNPSGERYEPVERLPFVIFH